MKDTWVQGSHVRRLLGRAAVMACACAGWAGARLNAADVPNTAPTYVFLLIGDGMGVNQVKLGALAAQAQGRQPLRMNALPVQGRLHTHSASSRITDSAAGGTALACGIKTKNGMLGLAPDGATRADSIAVALSRKGKKIGILTSTTANHATPAAFYAQVPSRPLYREIAEQFPGTCVDLLAGAGLGGGEPWMTEQLAAWQQRGIHVVRTVSGLDGVPRGARAAVFAGSLSQAADAEGDLPRMLAAAIRFLDNPEGFFIMAEGSGIDGAGHSNQPWTLIREMLMFDRAVEAAYQFYLKHPDRTLIVITADHETGGLAVDEARLDLDRLWAIEKQAKTFGDLIGKDAKALALPAVRQALEQAFGQATLTEADESALNKALDVSANRRLNAVLLAGRTIPQASAGISWSSPGHTDADVPILAVGAGAPSFAGTFDNTEVPLKIAALCGADKPGIAATAHTDKNAPAKPPELEAAHP